MVEAKVSNYVDGQKFSTLRQECKKKCVPTTTATCNLFPCKADRGPTVCEGGFASKTCMCAPGYCAIPFGITNEHRCVPSGETLGNATLLTDVRASDSGSVPPIAVLLAACSAAAVFAAVASQVRKGRAAQDEEEDPYRPL